MANEAFASYTRSASFALTLSARQINWLLRRAKIVELTERYPWYDGAFPINFGDETGARDAALLTDSTVRALVRRGLVTVTPRPLPTTDMEIVEVTRAGEILTDLLIEAGFEVDPRTVPKVHRHPDDRARIVVSGHGITHEPSGPDRRAPVHPGDELFLAGPVGVLGAKI